GVTAAARAAHARWDGNVVAVNSYSPRMALAFVCLHSLEFEEAATLFEQELVWAAERGLEAVEVVARVHLAQVQLRVGRWSEAHANARDAVEHARQATNAQIAGFASLALAAACALLGRHDEARQLTTEASAVAGAAEDFWVS